MCLCGALAVVAAEPAWAQQPASPPGSSGDQPAWTLEGHGGFMTTGSIASGTAKVPAPGANILTSSPTAPSRQVSSWFFGDGTSLLNGASAVLGVTSRVTPLDAAFAALGTGTGAGGGLRITRRLTSRFDVEFSLDVLAGSSSSANALRSAGSATSASFKSTFTDLLASGPIDGATVDSSSTASGGAGRDLVATGAIRWRLGSVAGWRTYATFGGGVVTRTGSLASVAVQGHYQFSVLSQVPIDETDSVVVRYASNAAPVGVAGAGVSRSISSAWSVNVDARVFIGGSDANLLLDASPSRVTGTPAGFIESGTSPALQFSNNASTGRQSTLSGPAISAFSAFSGGTALRVLVTFGIARRF